VEKPLDEESGVTSSKNRCQRSYEDYNLRKAWNRFESSMNGEPFVASALFI
jgi:hypothetical protein